MRTSHALLLVALLPTVAPAQLHPDTGDLLVSSWGNDRLLRLDHAGRQVSALSLPGLFNPRGIITSDDGTVFVMVEGANRVFVLDRTLAFVRSFATVGVSGPTGAAVRPNGNLLVSGFASGNVGEYLPDGTFVRTYSGGGLTTTNCVALRAGGGFYASNASGDRVHVFDANGNPSGSFTGFGMNSPMGVAVYGDEVFVACGISHNIVVFDLAGTPLREIRHPDMRGPQGVAFSADGRLVTSSYFNNKIVWFRPDGTHLATATPPSSSIPRSVAYLPGLRVEASGSPSPGVPFPFGVRCPNEPGVIYLTALALSNTPNVILPDGRPWALAPDVLFVLSLAPGPAFANFIGLLDATGTGYPVMTIPAVRGASGLPIHAGAVTIDPALPTLVRQVSDSVRWTL